MKRLLKKISRLRRIVRAEWKPVDINDPDLVQIITDSMAASTQIQVEYEGSGWRLISPYGWNTSKAGNILLMCYKDTGEVRSYRLDRILQVLIDDTMLQNQPSDTTMDGDGTYEIRDYHADPGDFEIPLLPNIDEILETSENEQGTKLPYDEGIDILTDQEVPVEQPQTPEVSQPKTDVPETQPEESEESEQPKVQEEEEPEESEDDLLDNYERKPQKEENK